jgi:glycerol-3-phosphate dehydrogenase
MSVSFRLDSSVGDVDGVEFDVVVIGGGITGICVAREAASRGLTVALFEAGDFGSGTSAATTKYIHGGIRYLEQYDIEVVRESLRERRVLALGAPHLVEQTRFIMPAWRWSKPPTALIGAGVLLYDALSFDRNRRAPDSLRIPHPRWLSRRRLLEAVPWLDTDGLQGAFAYHDTMNVHPERLLLAYAKSATSAGARLMNHAKVVAFEGSSIGADFRVDGVRVVQESREFVVRARSVVNAAGPWIDTVLAKLDRPMGVGVDRSKGVHILTRPIGGAGRVKDAVFARARSGRHVIVSPWMGKSFIGPTDTPIDGDESSVVVDPTDVDLILDTVNSTMSSDVDRLSVSDVEMTTVGVRPLIRTEIEGASSGTYSASRRHELYHHAERGVTNLWSIGGGKWTTGRATAEQMVDRLFENELSDRRSRRFDSRSTAAFGAFAWAQDADPFLREATAELTAVGLGVRSAENVARLYGSEWVEIARLVKLHHELADVVGVESDDIGAQVVFAVTHEAARNLSDVLDRRLVVGTLSQVSTSTIENVARIAAPHWGWDEKRIADEVRRESDRRTVTSTHWRTPTR